MPVAPADKILRSEISEILTRFESDYGLLHGPLGDLRNKIYESYFPGHIDGDRLRSWLTNTEDVDMRDKKLFLYLEPPKGRNILPLLTIQSSGSWVNFRIYTILNLLDDDSKLQAIGFRFETDEGQGVPIGLHDFCHAQIFNQLSRGPVVPIPSWLPDSQPSFPLDAEDQVGLVLCMLVALYGRTTVVSRLSGQGNQHLRKHLNKVRALRDPS